MTRKIYILSDNGHDYTDAMRFGTLVKLQVPSYAKHDVARIFTELKEGMREANEDDLIVVSHLSSHVAIATGIMVEWYGKVNLLIYRKDKYEEKNVVFTESED